MSPTIRVLRPDDRPYLVEALRSGRTFTEEEVGVALELIDNALDNGQHDYAVRVADLDGRPAAGYICFGRTPMTSATYDLYWLVTHAQARGRGVASALVRSMEEELRRVRGQSVRVETSLKESYGAARSLYEKLGYPMLAQFPDFYRPGDDLLVYYKRL
ncbi:MAG TPA: GNAT family N-acetyltransferase [Kofleriaceae bacterium]|nr:GNAT family N-acetyltransferase [Kofleriaceae bacterium]